MTSLTRIVSSLRPVITRRSHRTSCAASEPASSAARSSVAATKGRSHLQHVWSQLEYLRVQPGHLRLQATQQRGRHQWQSAPLAAAPEGAQTLGQCAHAYAHDGVVVREQRVEAGLQVAAEDLLVLELAPLGVERGAEGAWAWAGRRRG